jgi:uncharacterized protein (DUF697 family)
MKSLTDADAEAQKCLNDHSWSNGIIGFIPGSTVILTPKQAFMINQIAKIYEVEYYSTEVILGMIGTAVGGMALSESLSLIPVIGWIGKAAAAASVTKVAGEIIISYMREKSPLS